MEVEFKKKFTNEIQARSKKTSNEEKYKVILLKGEALLGLDEYLDFQERLNYGFMLHCVRM